MLWKQQYNLIIERGLISSLQTEYSTLIQFFTSAYRKLTALLQRLLVRCIYGYIEAGRVFH